MIFYGRDNHDGNFKITYTTSVKQYLYNWPIVKKMIESINLIGNIEPIEANGLVIGKTPTGIFYDDKEKIIFVCNRDDNTISIVNATNFKVLKTIKSNLGVGPFDLSYNSITTTLYVIHNKEESGFYGKPSDIKGAISKIKLNQTDDGNIDFTPNYKLSPIINDTSIFPIDIVTNKFNKVFVVDSNNTLYILDGEDKKNNLSSISLSETNKKEKAIGMGLAIDDSSNILYIANSINNAIQIYDINQNKTESIPTKDKEGCPIDIAVDASNNRLYCTRY